MNKLQNDKFVGDAKENQRINIKSKDNLHSQRQRLCGTSRRQPPDSAFAFHRGRDLEHLQAIAKRYKTSAKLLDEVALDPSASAQGDGRRHGSGFVTLSTVHSAKGLEWNSLFVIWMADGWFPSNRFQDEFDDLEEERRLLYVANTRAKRDLHFVYPVNVYRGPETDSLPAVSRFLEPIPTTIFPHGSLLAQVRIRMESNDPRTARNFPKQFLPKLSIWTLAVRLKDRGNKMLMAQSQ